VCFFFVWGLGGFLADELDLLLVTGMASGIVTDLLTNSVLRSFEKAKGENARWIMVSRKTCSSFFLNILYAYVVLFLVYVLYNVINLATARITGAVDRVVLGVEPTLALQFSGTPELHSVRYLRTQSSPVASEGTTMCFLRTYFFRFLALSPDSTISRIIFCKSVSSKLLLAA